MSDKKTAMSNAERQRKHREKRQKMAVDGMRQESALLDTMRQITDATITALLTKNDPTETLVKTLMALRNGPAYTDPDLYDSLTKLRDLHGMLEVQRERQPRWPDGTVRIV